MANNEQNIVGRTKYKTRVSQKIARPRQTIIAKILLKAALYVPYGGTTVLPTETCVPIVSLPGTQSLEKKKTPARHEGTPFFVRNAWPAAAADAAAAVEDAGRISMQSGHLFHSMYYRTFLHALPRAHIAASYSPESQKPGPSIGNPDREPSRAAACYGRFVFLGTQYSALLFASFVESYGVFDRR